MLRAFHLTNMIKRLVKVLTKKGILYLRKKGIDIYTEIELSKDEKRFIQLQQEIGELNMKMTQLRLDLILVYDKFLGEMQNVYLSLLAESKDDKLMTTMTKHWMDTQDQVHEMYGQHKGIMGEISIRVQELEKISVANKQS